MHQFSQNAGPFGPMAATPGWYTRPANPWVHKRVQFAVGASRPQTTSATLAGKPDSCCASCANDHRHGHR